MEDRKLTAAPLTPATPMLADEILSGQSQGGVKRPDFLKDHEDDGTVERVTGPGQRPHDG